MFTEPLVLLTDLFLLYQYCVLFLYFEAYPIIFKGETLVLLYRIAGLINRFQVLTECLQARLLVCFFQVCGTFIACFLG